jgi:hypothetical protein
LTKSRLGQVNQEQFVQAHAEHLARQLEFRRDLPNCHLKMEIANLMESTSIGVMADYFKEIIKKRIELWEYESKT